MPVFNGSTETRTRVAIDQDSWTPGMGSLSAGGNKEDALVHGNKNEVIDGNQTSRVGISRTWNTTVNFQCTVGVQRKLQELMFDQTTNALYKIQVMGPTLDNRTGPTNHTFVSPLVENHASPRSTNEPASSMNLITSFLATFIDEKNIAVNSSEAYANKFALSGLNNDHKAIANGLVGFENKVAGFCLTTEVFENKTTAIFNTPNPLESKIGAMKAELEALEGATGLQLSSLKMAVNSFAM